MLPSSLTLGTCSPFWQLLSPATPPFADSDNRMTCINAEWHSGTVCALLYLNLQLCLAVCLFASVCAHGEVNAFGAHVLSGITTSNSPVARILRIPTSHYITYLRLGPSGNDSKGRRYCERSLGGPGNTLPPER